MSYVVDIDNVLHVSILSDAFDADIVIGSSTPPPPPEEGIEKRASVFSPLLLIVGFWGQCPADNSDNSLSVADKVPQASPAWVGVCRLQLLELIVSHSIQSIPSNGEDAEDAAFRHQHCWYLIVYRLLRGLFPHCTSFGNLYTTIRGELAYEYNG